MSKEAEEFLKDLEEALWAIRNMDCDVEFALPKIKESFNQEVKKAVLKALEDLDERFKESIMLEAARIIIESEFKPKYK